MIALAYVAIAVWLTIRSDGSIAVKALCWAIGFPAGWSGLRKGRRTTGSEHVVHAAPDNSRIEGRGWTALAVGMSCAPVVIFFIVGVFQWVVGAVGGGASLALLVRVMLDARRVHDYEAANGTNLLRVVRRGRVDLARHVYVGIPTSPNVTQLDASG